MKKAKVKQLKTSIAIETTEIESCFDKTPLGYWKAKKIIPHQDAADYVVSKLEIGASAIRSAILCMSAVIQQDTVSAIYLKKALAGRWSKVTLANLFSIAKQLPKFEKIGLQIDKVQDIYGLREVSSLIKKGNPERILALLNGGASPRKAKNLIENKSKYTNSESFDKEIPRNLGNDFSERGHEFEKLILPLLKKMYPEIAWQHTGNLKRMERGLDYIGVNMINHSDIYGVQCKNHDFNNCPSDEEWVKFLAGCFTRRVTKAIFITTGRLNSNQLREVTESGIITVISGQNISSYLETYKIPNLLKDF
jgi:hypothetical protein